MTESTSLAEIEQLIAFDKRATLPDVPGVYWVYDANKKVRYVGQAINLRKRLTNHNRTKDFKAVNAKFVGFMEVYELADLGWYEDCMICKYDPDLNKTMYGATSDFDRISQRSYVMRDSTYSRIAELKPSHWTDGYFIDQVIRKFTGLYYNLTLDKISHEKADIYVRAINSQEAIANGKPYHFKKVRRPYVVISGRDYLTEHRIRSSFRNF